MAKTTTQAQTSAQSRVTYTCAIDKIRDEMAEARADSQINLLGEGVTALLQLHPELEKHILEPGKTLKGALGAVRANATGGCSDPIQTTKSLCKYYGIECKNPHVLAMEVTVALLGGEGTAAPDAQPGGEETSSDPAKGGATFPNGGRLLETGKAGEADPFDLDALLGGL